MYKYTIQDIFSKYGNDYIVKHNLSKEQWKVFNSIRNCKTKKLGYHICTCQDCGEEYFGYNSCRNRHCPMCQAYQREKWIHFESILELGEDPKWLGAKVGITSIIHTWGQTLEFHPTYIL